MISQLTAEQRHRWREFRAFADGVIAPAADTIDARQEIPRPLIRELGEAGWLSAMLPERWGGRGLDAAHYGMMAEELGRTCSNVRNFVAVQDMVSHAVSMWGIPEQKLRWLPEIAAGRRIAAFLLTEPDTGSDAQDVRTEAKDDGSEIVVSGAKKWISFGQCADLFLVFVQYQGRHTAILVERDSPGVHVTPLTDMLGLRGSMLAEITFEECRVPADSVIGHPGSGLAFVAANSLDIGRYSTAWGCVGLAQACLDASSAYAAERRQYGKPLADHQLVQQMLADMLTQSRAARLLCWQAGQAADREDEDSHYEALTAKYFSSTVAARIAGQAVQIHGARGMGAGAAVGRFFRDAKAMEIIEGASQVIQQLLGRWSAVAGHPSALGPSG
ncbi:acyl-CoA dehydrogenase family protein [Streptomyces sp. ADMS]|uniref:acyl-CoA dehydrogenase family protein n=1 Tax=Streptomyces sp. ADMS TaxID=3071415 RepID=UPI00296F3204|nr:acyl-CoA dehydrogenase family protein [Streptomyces sp. ADMS]MDW4909123.1 acyl-CoA dehydrogenase family protein [Streptomyces sp. ADMS]